MSNLKKISEQKGITLIALVITIIVLLILAAISISMLSGDNSILNRATQAKNVTGEKQIQEKIRLAVAGAIANGNGSITEDLLTAELNKQFGENGYELIDKEDDSWDVKVGEVIENVKKSGAITGGGDEQTGDLAVTLTLNHQNETLSTGGNISRVISRQDPSNNDDGDIPIPTGFYYVGGTRDTGVVISDDPDDENTTNTTVADNLEGNQFVWVPVNQNQTLTLNVTTDETITSIKLIGPDGTESNLLTSKIQEISMQKDGKYLNGVYTVEVTTTNHTQKVQKRISSLYGQDIEMLVIPAANQTKETATETYNTTQELLTAKSASSVEELLESASAQSMGMYMAMNRVWVNDQEEALKEFARSFMSQFVDNNQNLISVNKYGGFYIARFEAGDGTTSSARDTSTSDSDVLVSRKGAYVYNYVNVDTAKTLSTGLKTSDSSSVTSQLITGAGWDRTLNWLIETKAQNGLDESKVILDSTSWGNYSNSTGNAAINSGSSNMNYTTGRSEYWKANNIYDLAGNTYEWTQETQGTISIIRGGVFYDSGDSRPASVRSGGDSTGQNYNISFRPQLYIKQ